MPLPASLWARDNRDAYVRIRIVCPAVGEGPRRQFAISYLLNDTLAIDAGGIGFLTPVAAQQRIQHVLLSHGHADHVASLPIFLDNVYKPVAECPSIYASAATLQSLRRDVFNEHIWPDLIRLSGKETPFLKMIEMVEGKTIEFGELRVTPVALNHVTPTLGFVIEDPQSAVALVSDTAPTDEIWRVLNQTANLRAVFLEASFPNSMQWLADAAMHLTPATFASEARKLNHPTRLVAIHLKPAFHEQIASEIADLNLPDVEIVDIDREYEF